MTPKSWKAINPGSTDWVDFVADVGIVSSVLLANANLTDAINVTLRLATGAIILPLTSLAAGSSQSLNMRSLVIVTGDKLQIQASASGINAIASGAV